MKCGKQGDVSSKIIVIFSFHEVSSSFELWELQRINQRIELNGA